MKPQCHSLNTNCSQFDPLVQGDNMSSESGFCQVHGGEILPKSELVSLSIRGVYGTGEVLLWNYAQNFRVLVKKWATVGDRYFSTSKMEARPKIQRISHSSPISEIISAIEQDGVVIMTDFADPQDLAQVQRDVQPYLDSDTGVKIGGEIYRRPVFDSFSKC